jgi:hypothetical protein
MGTHSRSPLTFGSVTARLAEGWAAERPCDRQRVKRERAFLIAGGLAAESV